MRKSRYTIMAILKRTKAGARVLLIFPPYKWRYYMSTKWIQKITNAQQCAAPAAIPLRFIAAGELKRYSTLQPFISRY